MLRIGFFLIFCCLHRILPITWRESFARKTRYQVVLFYLAITSPVWILGFAALGVSPFAMLICGVAANLMDLLNLVDLNEDKFIKREGEIVFK